MLTATDIRKVSAQDLDKALGILGMRIEEVSNMVDCHGNSLGSIVKVSLNAVPSNTYHTVIIRHEDAWNTRLTLAISFFGSPFVYVLIHHSGCTEPRQITNLFYRCSSFEEFKIMLDLKET